MVAAAVVVGVAWAESGEAGKGVELDSWWLCAFSGPSRRLVECLVYRQDSD